MALTTQQLQSVQKCIGVDVDKLIADQPTSERTIRQAWNSIVEPLQEFALKYGGNGKQQG